MPVKHPRFQPIRTLLRTLYGMVLVFAFLSVQCLLAQGLRLDWNPNPEPDIAGYLVHYGTESGVLSEEMDVGKVTTAILESLEPSTTYYFAVRAYNTAGIYSDFSDEISYITHDPPPNGLFFHNAAGKILPASGSIDLGTVRLGAMGSKRGFTLTNHGKNTISGLRLTLDGSAAGDFIIDGMPWISSVIANGSFENGFDGWTASGSVRHRLAQTATHGNRLVDFSSGNQPNDGVLRQTFPTVPETKYTLTFDYGILSYNPILQSIRTRIQGNQSLLVDDANITGPGGGTTVWASRSLDFTADSALTTITFEDASTTTIGVDLTLDHVRVIDAAMLTKSAGISLAAGKSVAFTVLHQPAKDGSGSADLTLIADEIMENPPHLQLRGTGSMQFEPWLAARGAAGDAFGTPNGGNLNYLQQYAFGVDPGTSRTGSVSVANGVVTTKGTPAVRVLDALQNQFDGLYGRRKDHEMVGLKFTPQFSADLITWQNASSQQVVVGEDGEIEVVAVRAPATIEGRPARFFRVGVSQHSSLPTFGKWLTIHNLSSQIPGEGGPNDPATRQLMDYAFGLDPGMAREGPVAEIGGLVASRGYPSVRPPAPGQDGFQGLFARRKNHVEAVLAYLPQFSADLVNWHDAGNLPVVIADDGEIEVVSVSVPAMIDGMPVRFFRVGINWQSPQNFGEWLDHYGISAGPENSPDGLQAQYLISYAFGLPPGIAPGRSVAEGQGRVISRGQPVVRPPDDDDGAFQGLFGRRKNHAEAGLSYRPQFSADLINWHAAENPPVVLADDGEIEVVSVSAPAMIDGMPARFFRVGISYNP